MEGMEGAWEAMGSRTKQVNWEKEEHEGFYKKGKKCLRQGCWQSIRVLARHKGIG